MNHELFRIEQRLKDVDKAIADLEAERRALKEMRVAAQVEGLLRPGEKIDGRNREKLVLLSKVVDFLRRRQREKSNGAAAREIHEHLLRTYSEALKYNTLRSHLTRFKAEGRLDFNPATKRWSVAQQEGD